MPAPPPYTKVCYGVRDIGRSKVHCDIKSVKIFLLLCSERWILKWMARTRRGVFESSKSHLLCTHTHIQQNQTIMYLCCKFDRHECMVPTSHYFHYYYIFRHNFSKARRRDERSKEVSSPFFGHARTGWVGNDDDDERQNESNFVLLSPFHPSSSLGVPSCV